MAESIQADDSDVKIGSDEGSDDVVAKGADKSGSGAELGQVESIDEPEEEAPTPEPPPPPASPLPEEVQQIADQAVEPGREALPTAQSNATLESTRGDQSFQALLAGIQKQYADQLAGVTDAASGTADSGTGASGFEGTGQGGGDQQSRFAAAIAAARHSLTGARGETIEHENTRAHEFGDFMTKQHEAEQKRQDDFAAREEERQGLLKDWNTQLETMRGQAAQRQADWGNFMTQQQAGSEQRRGDWAQFLLDSQARASQRAADWQAYMDSTRSSRGGRRR